MTAATVPYWLEEPYEPRPPLQGDVEVEACVIGGGVGGLSCARRLAQHGIETLVLDCRTVAGGASGRNGGFLLAGLAAFHVDAQERYGHEYARRAYARTLAAQQEMYALAAELGAADAVRRTGLLRVSSSEEDAEHVRRHVAALRADGFPGELIEGDELPAALRRSVSNACLTEHDGALHPVRWIRALARGAEQAGARIHERSPVKGPVRAPEEGPVLTDAGRVRARHVIVAADGALPALVPHYHGLVRARRLHMVATASLPLRLVDPLVYARWGYEYFQQRPDGRVLAGGFSDVDGDDSYLDRENGSPRIWERIERYLCVEIDVDAPITHRWVGVVGYSDDGRPFVGGVAGQPGLYVAGGYSGVGNVPGFVAGQELADVVGDSAGGEVSLFPADR